MKTRNDIYIEDELEYVYITSRPEDPSSAWMELKFRHICINILMSAEDLRKLIQEISNYINWLEAR